MKGGNIAIHYGLILAHLLLVAGFGTMLAGHFTEKSVTKMMSLYSLVLIGLSFLISFIMSLFNPNLTVIYKIIYLILICIVGSLIIFKLDNLTETFCASGGGYAEPTSFHMDPEYKQYYEGVMNRNQNDLMSPWKEVYQTKGQKGNTNVMPLKDNYFQ